MRWIQTEYVLKGIFLGLLTFAALQAAGSESPDWATTGKLGLCVAGGLALALGVAAASKLRAGYEIKGRLPAFVLFLLLESSTLVYTGILVGMAAGVVWAFSVGEATNTGLSFFWAVIGGALLGIIFGSLKQVENRWYRIALCLVMGTGIVAAALYYFGLIDPQEGHQLPKHPEWFGIYLLVGMPIFYLLTFSGHEEESEVEIGAICAGLGLGIGIIYRDNHNVYLSAAILLVAFYLAYTWYILPGLRVFKHVLRGLSHAQGGRHRQALQAYRRALQLDPKNQMAREGFWAVHRSLDLDELAKDPQTLALVDLDLCLQRAGSLLLEPQPAQEKLGEAHRLLDLVAHQRPAMQPAVDYWRSVAMIHTGQVDQAASTLERVVGHAYGTTSPQRKATLFPAWQLALILHDGMKQRVGLPQLALPGRRMEAIAAVERHLADNPKDSGAWSLKRMLYQDVTETDYDDAAGAHGAVAADFDHNYVQELGLALINDPQRWQRGGEYLRLAARGLPALGPSLFIQIAQAHERAGNRDGVWHNYELAKRAGQSVGPKNLAEEDRHAYFGVVKYLADAARHFGYGDKAIEHYQLYTEYERSGLETLRILADLFEKKGDPLAALHATEQALIYNPKDPDLLQRKDRYYYSVSPETFRGHPEAVPKAFDVGYCLRKAKQVLTARDIDLDTLDWGQHLAALALAVQPENVAAKLLMARASLRRGERDEALALLDGIRANKPEKFTSEEEEEAWFMACRLLGDLYLGELGRPDLAVPCFQDFRQSAKSGADTSYKLGQAYEQLGDRPKAVKCYQQVTSFDGHPLAADAHDALYRLQAH
jgi:tetratricopeptide (TPR) repeat protein